MKQKIRIAVGFLALTLFLPLAGYGAALHVGDKAPDFTLPDQNGKEISLLHFRGKENVVLAFYVLAFTGG
jgi:cytochrome oxidase Cu insertion factor (SCO1/SenC/PrrC family)